LLPREEVELPGETPAVLGRAKLEVLFLYGYEKNDQTTVYIARNPTLATDVKQATVLPSFPK
jgi:hypothetical protein